MNSPEQYSESKEVVIDRRLGRRLSEVAFSDVIEESDQFRIEQLKEELGLTERKPKSPYLVSYEDEGDLDLKQVEHDQEQRFQCGECMLGYFEGCEAMEDFNVYHKYIDRREAEFLINIDKINPSMVNKNFYLMQIHNNVIGRAKNNDEPENWAGRSDLTKLRHALKTGFILNFNGMISDYIDSISKKNNRLGLLEEKLKLIFLDITNSTYNKDLKTLDNLDCFFEDNRYLSMVFKLIDGMRHELGFRELVDEISDEEPGLIEAIEADKDSDSHGVDLILKVKLSKDKTNDRYSYASSEEIEAGDYIEKELGVDIKSNERTAQRTIAGQDPNHRPDHWIMWSHLRSEDFRLGINEFTGKPDIIYSRSNTPIYLSVDGQISVMKEIYATQLLRYKEEFGDEKYVKYELIPLQDRLHDIKQEILKGINTVYREDSEGASSEAKAS